MTSGSVTEGSLEFSGSVRLTKSALEVSNMLGNYGVGGEL